MSYFKSGYFTPQYFNKYWQAEGAGDTARLTVLASATSAFTANAFVESTLNVTGQATAAWVSAEPEAVTGTMTATASAVASWEGLGGLPDEPVVQPPQVIGGGAAASQSRPLLCPWEAFEPTVLRARATITGTAAVEAVLSDPELSAKIAAQNAQLAQQEIDEDDQFVLSFVTAFLSEQNGCEINGFVS